MSSLRAILEAAADQIRETMEAESDWAIQVEPSMILNPTPPSIDVFPGPQFYDVTTGSFGSTFAQMAEGERVDVLARVNPNDNTANQELLAELMDPASSMSLVQSIYDDPTLGGVVADMSLESCSGFQPAPRWDGGMVYLGVLWRFLVLPESS